MSRFVLNPEDRFSHDEAHLVSGGTFKFFINTHLAGPSHKSNKRISHGKILWPFFLSLYTARPSFEYYRRVYFIHTGLQDESLQVTISKLP